eukprot:TRINITY_DN7086_c0_g1_i1.p1 TRINITY_DN7086_c0_g1~~TRINITY_DN7086_c0_g1_i1.p1  ORF type:complete len:371 (+),score=24.22 TRINITY_DN7086_c0_g1_i1:71-1183(+)
MCIRDRTTSVSDEGFSWDCVIRAIPALDNFLKYLMYDIYGFYRVSHEGPWFHLIFEVYLLIFITIFYTIRWTLFYHTMFGCERRRASLVGTIVVIIFNLLPNFQKYVLDVFECKNVGEKDQPILYLRGNYELQCYSPLYYKLAVKYVTPIAIFILFVMPLICMMMIRSIFKNDEQNRPVNLMRFGFLYSGYKANVYFWEFFISARKLLLILLIMMLSRYSSKLQVLSVMLMIQVAYAAQLTWKPYVENDLNRLERVSLTSALIITVSSLFFALYTDSGEERHFLKAYFINGLILVSSIFYFVRVWTAHYYTTMAENVKIVSHSWVKWMVETLCCLTCCHTSENSSVNESQETLVRNGEASNGEIEMKGKV